MRLMKDKERLMIVIKVFLELNGPSTASEISEYANNCSVGFQMLINPRVVGTFLRGKKEIKKLSDENPQKYAII